MATEIKAGNKDKSKVVSVKVEFPADHASAVDAWGEEALFNLALRQANTDVQNAIRVHVRDQEGTEESAQALADNWTPSTRRAGVPRKASIEKFSKEQLLAQLRKLEEAE